MAFIEDVRNVIVKGLTQYMGVPVILSDQIKKETPVPFMIYSVVSPHIPAAGVVYARRFAEDGHDVESVRTEQPTATLSFTACSENRDGSGGKVSGESEAIALAEKATGWFRHVGYHLLQSAGLVVVEVQSPAPRSTFVVVETARRWGFDVTIRYSHTIVRNDSAIDTTTIFQRRDTE